MLRDGTEATEVTLDETTLGGAAGSRDDAVQRGAVLVVQAAAPNQFPNALDRVELRTVGRKKMQVKVSGDLGSPSSRQDGVVIARVVDDDDDLASALPAHALEFPQEVPAGDRIEHAFGRAITSLPSLSRTAPKKLMRLRVGA